MKRKELKSSIKNLNKEIKSQESLSEKKDRQLKKLKKAFLNHENANKNNEFMEKSEEELNKKLSEYTALKNELQKKLGDYWKIKNELSNIRQEIRKIKDQNKQILKKSLDDIDKRIKKNGLPNIDSIPSFKENEEWPESDKVQQSFDKKATNSGNDIVMNGVGQFAGERSILMTIDMINNGLKEIDLVEIFKKKMGLDQFQNYNDYLSEIRNTDIVEDDKVNIIKKNYFPVTTKYDIVRSETSSKNTKEILNIKNKYKNLISELSKIIKIKFKNVKRIKFKGNLDEGIIDGRNVWKIPNNIDNKIFEKAFEKPNDKVSVAIAIDISGSQDKEFTENGKKIKELAVILSSALTKAMIKHEVIGYGAPADSNVEKIQGNDKLYTRTRHRLETVIYKSFNGADGLGNIEIKCWDNVDSESLKLISKRLLKTRSKKKVIFNITDGKPFLHGADTGVLDNDLIKTIDWIKNRNIDIYGFGFNDYPLNFLNKNYAKIDKYESLVGFFKEIL